MKQFVPIECNPEVFSELARNFGVKNVEFSDIFSLDPEMLEFIPRPVLAVLLVFPISETYEKYRKETDAKVQEYNESNDPNVYWARQTIGNACGTMAFLHATNNVHSSNIQGTMSTILAETAGLNPEERARYLENSTEFEAAHSAVAQQGDTLAPDSGDNVEFHYVCLTKGKNGELYELDGRRKGPISRGKVDDLLGEGGLKVIHEFISREGNGAFSMIAMTGN